MSIVVELSRVREEASVVNEEKELNELLDDLSNRSHELVRVIEGLQLSYKLRAGIHPSVLRLVEAAFRDTADRVRALALRTPKPTATPEETALDEAAPDER
jgi:hypothetical protein